ncbi:CvpA family protein [soil metagenome]
MAFANLNGADYAIISVIGLSSLISLIRGFVKEALSLAGWIIAFWVALTFCNELSNHFTKIINSVPIRTAAAFFLLFALTLIAMALINHIISCIVTKTGLSGTDRILGVLFGFGRGMFVVSVLLLVAKMSTLPNDKMWQESQLIPSFRPLEIWLHGFLPEDLGSDFMSPETLKQTVIQKGTEMLPAKKS